MGIETGLSSLIATCVILPIDVLKTRQQLKFDRTMMNVSWMHFYRAIPFAVPRDIIYTSLRFELFNKFKSSNPQHVIVNATVGIGVGVFGGILVHPIDHCKVFMLGNPEIGYKSMVQLVQKRGIHHGISTTVFRAATMNATQVSHRIHIHAKAGNHNPYLFQIYNIQPAPNAAVF